VIQAAPRPTSRIFERNTESAARQYALRDHAVELGWPQESVAVVDGDTGRSGASAAGRLGFKELVAEVGLGHVGVVLALEVSRLARSSADWHRLLDLCALTATLIADADGVYSPADFNDRLLLGLKGTMSEAATRPPAASCARAFRWGSTVTRTGASSCVPMSRSATPSSACSCCGGGSGRRARW
jgi:DNA invertase Pin-like site-specific DNA recombinase